MTTTRAESQARTRETLVQVAHRLFLRDGYAATSLERVAVEAGFSKGAVYSNFSGKEELGLAVLDEMHQEQVDEVLVVLAGAETIDELLAGLGGWIDHRVGRPRDTALEVELASVATRSPEVARAIAESNRQLRTALGELVRRASETYGVSSELSPDEIATVLLSLGVGLGLQRSIDPSVQTDVFTATLRHLFGTPH